MLMISCSAASTPSPQTTAAASPSTPAAAIVAVRAPAVDLLSGNQAGLPPGAGRDQLSLTEAASLEQNQPLALTRYRAWGWVDEATRAWGDSSHGFDDSLLLLTRVEGAQLAFRSWSGDLVQETPCPASPALDECAQGEGGLVARIDRFLFRLRGSGVDLVAAAARQAEAIRRP
jgi:hypothetical protein